MTDHYKIRFEWNITPKLLLFSVFLFPLLVYLGLWQLERAEEKTAILERYDNNKSKKTINVTELDDESDLQYRPAFVNGTLISGQRIFLDYKVKNGKPGYEVYEHLIFKDLRDRSDKALLVNRGWIKASLNREILPDVKSIESIQKYKGTLYKRLKGGISLDDGIRSPKSWPVRLGSIDIERAKDIFESRNFFKYQLRLDQGSVGALDASWETVSVKPSKHFGYAIQWFVMSFVLLVMTFVANSNVIVWVTSRFMK